MDVGPPELLIILVIVVLLFGGAKLPKLARSLGQAKSEFEKGVRGSTPASEHDAAPPPSVTDAAPGAESGAPVEDSLGDRAGGDGPADS